MANGKGSGCFVNGMLTLLVVAFVVGAFFLGAFTEHETGMVFGDAAKVKPRGQQADAQGGDAPDGATDGAASEASGTVLYDGDDMRVTYLRLEDTPGLEAATLYLEVENKTSEKVTAGPEIGSVDVNGYNITTMGGAIAIDPGNKSVAGIILGYKQFDATSVEGIKSISMNLQLLNESIDVVAEAPISMTF